jgi:hypothetical protein
MFTLLTTSTCSHPDYNAGCDLAVIAIDARYARRRLHRLDALTHLQAGDRSEAIPRRGLEAIAQGRLPPELQPEEAP